MRKKALPPGPSAALAANRVNWVRIKGVRVLRVDFSGLPPEASHAVVDHFEAAIRNEKAGSVLMLTDVSNAEYDASILTKWRRARFEHDAKIRRSAVFGASGLVLIAVKTFYQMLELMGIPDVSQRVRLSADEEEATTWLLKEPRRRAGAR